MKTQLNRWRGLIDHYREFLPVTSTTPVCTLLEGNTPLFGSRRIGPELGLDLYFKYEGLNPTGSFKDRGMTVAISKAMERGATAVICASTGNTSASAAAYAAASGLRCAVVIPEGKIAPGKLAQALAHGATVIAIEGNFDEALQIVRELTSRHEITLVNSLNPDRLQGQKTGAFEVCDTLGDAPEYLAIPVGNAGNITAYWMGFREYHSSARSTRRPKMLGFQAAGAAPIVRGEPVANPETIATAIRIGNPVRWKEAEQAVAESGGSFTAVTDEEILAAYEWLAGGEGLMVEPASAASVAGITKLVREGKLLRGGTVVCVLTGHGLKDPTTVSLIKNQVRACPSTTAAVEALVFGKES